MTELIPKKPVMLIIMDGWGIREMEDGNAVQLANTPNYDTWLQTKERAVVDASEEAVGLIPGQMGNSEVGHLNLGAGRVVYQDISRINNAIRDDELKDNPSLNNAFQHLKKTGGNLHLIGLLSDGGVHSLNTHLYALLKIAASKNITPIVHVITDGRDTPTASGIGFAQELEEKIKAIGAGRIATVSGRYYTMDRDKRWQRTEQAFNAMVKREAAKQAENAVNAIQQSYDEGVTDEFILPATIGNDNSLKINDGDALLFYNFRADRMRQIVRAFMDTTIEGFERDIPDNLFLGSFTSYADDLPTDIFFGKETLKNTLAEVISNANLSQYHTAETEKYPHVTFFFNGRREDPFPQEDRQIVPSPKVATYDLQPEMSAPELTEKTLERLKSHDDAFILVNYANPDMVGHTGSLDAAIKAVEVVDEAVGKLVEAVLAKDGVAIVTADHGNCERMVELSTGDAHTYHTTNPVSLFIIGKNYYLPRPRGKLADVAPTVLELLGIEQPGDMTGLSLIEAVRES